MKKIIKIITMFIILVLLCETSYAAEYLNSVEFTEKSVNDTAMWSGREWITDRYPPKISQDGIEFTEVEWNEEVLSNIWGYSQVYVWTGNDYLVYSSNHRYYDYNSSKYLYRISEDFKSLLNTYKIPNWINYMEFIDDKVFIATENVYPNYRKPGDVLSGVWSVSHSNFEVYYSTDFIEWIKIDYNSDYHITMNKVNNKLLIDNYLYSDGKMNKVLWERSIGHFACNTDQYLCTLCAIQEKNGDEVKNKSVLCFSKDGIYWSYLDVDTDIYSPVKILRMGDDIVIGGSWAYYACEWEKINSNINLPSDPIYIKLNDNILGFEEPPVIENGRTLVPMRFLFEQMGAEVEWNGETQNATATLDNKTVTFEIDNINAEVNNAPAVMDIPARLINGKTMVPLRFLSENMGYTVDWDADSRTAIIN